MDFNKILVPLTEKARLASVLGKTLKLDFGEKKIFIDGTGEVNEVNTEDKEADCTVKVSMEDFLAMNKGELNPMTAVMSGKIKISGDMGIAMKLQSLLG